MKRNRRCRCPVAFPVGESVRWPCAVLMVIAALSPLAPCSAQETPLVVTEKLQANVKAAITRAAASPAMSHLAPGTGQASLTAYALIKLGRPADSPEIRAHLQELQRKLDDGPVFRPNEAPDSHVYETVCHAMLLADTDPAGNRVRLEGLRDYLIQAQLPNGSWYYPNVPSPAAGDTSVTQFAILGFWAIHRAQIEVPRDSLARAAKWLIATQRSDGGFAYHPFEGGGRPEDLVTSESMTAAGFGTLALIKLLLYGDPLPAPAVQAPARRKFGVLMQAAHEGPETSLPKPVKRSSSGTVSVSRDALDKAIASSSKTLGERFADGMAGKFPVYFLYACERALTIQGLESIGGHDWYGEGVDFLLARQAPSGEWGEFGGHVPGVANTAFATLFLSRATRTLIKTSPQIRLVGGGLLAGGRGLPDELDRVDMQDGSVKQRLRKGPVDDLLGQLEQPQEISLPSIQKAIVESVSLENPEELVGQLDRLLRLIRHPSAEVRQVAVWALGRSGEYRMAPALIERLADSDRVVAWEASMALCVLSRMPLGITPLKAKQPLSIAPPEIDAANAATQTAYQRWVDQSQAAWDAWYLRVRPYDERDDRRQLPAK